MLTDLYTWAYTSRMTTMIRAELSTRDQLMRVAAEDFGGVTADEALQRLLEEHRQHKMVAVMNAFRETDPAGWQSYLDEADDWDRASAAPLDEWRDEAVGA